MKVEYEWKEAGRYDRFDVQKIGERIDRIRDRDGAVTPDAVLREARKKTSPLHEAFEWDDAAAAHQHRLATARSIIRSITVRVIDANDDEPIVTRAFVHTGEAYEDIHTVLSHVDKRDALLATALDEFQRLRRKYEHLKELASVYAALDDAAA